MKQTPMRHLTLKRLREQKGLSLDTASKLFGIKKEKLKAYEEYKEIPSSKEVMIMLKMLGLYYVEIVYIIFEDINNKYKN